MAGINHRSLFRAFIISCLAYVGFLIIVNTLDIWSDNTVAFLVTLGIPAVIFILALFTLISGIVSCFIKKDSISLPRLMVYFAIFIPIFCIIIWLIQIMTQGFS